MIIQISSKRFTMVLVLGDDNAGQKLDKHMESDDKKGPPENEKQPQRPVGSNEALQPTVIGFVKT